MHQYAIWATAVLLGLGIGFLLLPAQYQKPVSAPSTITPLSVLPKPEPVVEQPKKVLDVNSIVRTINDLTVGERKALLAKIMPRGIPPIYGTELSISFDNPETAIQILSRLDGEWVNEKNGIKFSVLDSNAQQRYPAIGSQISCEFCCGARTLVAKNGDAACQCSHSAAMRGLAKYLLQKYASEFSNEQILEELTKIKTISFPQQMVRRALDLQANGKPINAITQNLPAQVGGC